MRRSLCFDPSRTYSPDSLERTDGLVILMLQLFHHPKTSDDISADKTHGAFIDKSAPMFDQSAQVTHRPLPPYSVRSSHLRGAAPRM
jgi:hypothetical protein